MADLADRSAVALVADLRVRKHTVRDTVAACLARIGETNGVPNAVCTLSPAALADAEAAAAGLPRGRPRRLEGVPFLVKDVIPTRGLRTTYGSKLHEHPVSAEDAVSHHYRRPPSSGCPPRATSTKSSGRRASA